MPAPRDNVDIEALLAPIAPDAPAGTSLRYEGTYDKVKEARRADDSSLPQGEWKAALKKADYGAVASICADAIAHRSKDLQLAVWLAEAWSQLRGVPGVSDGLRLGAGLVARFWDTMFPPAADDAGEGRAALVEWLDDTLALRLRLVPLSPEAGGAAFSLSEWEAARDRAARPPPRGREEPRGPSWEAILGQISAAGRATWHGLHDQVGDALRAADELEQALAAHMSTPPVVRRSKSALREIAGIAEQALRSLGDAPRAEAEPEAPAAEAGEPALFAPSGPIQSRNEAYLRLTEAADYLMRTEPHSPVPYLVMRAVSWGNMSLAELLHEFIDRADDLVAIQELLGMRRRE